MKTEPILRELEAVKEQFAAEAAGDSRCFLDQMESWLERHPHAGPMVNSPDELQSRLRAREASASLPPPAKPYRVRDAVIAEVHQTRKTLYQKMETEGLILKDEPPNPRG